TFALEISHLRGDPQRSIAQRLRRLADGKTNFFLSRARRCERTNNQKTRHCSRDPQSAILNPHGPTSHHSITPRGYLIPLITHSVFRPVHIGRNTECRCLPPATMTMMSSALVER